MSETIDSLSIEITSNAARATKAISSLTQSLQGLKAASSSTGLGKVTESLSSIQGVSSGMQTVSQTAAKANKSLKSLFASLKDVGKEARKKIANPFKDATKGSSQLWTSLKRIAMYRFLRTVLKDIAAAGREGVQNLYQWSKAFEGATYGQRTFTQVMDRGAESILYLKNAMGTALASVISAFEPLLYRLADAVVAAVNAFNNLWAVLNGDSSYNRAIRKTTEFAKATGNAAKEVKNLVFGFDELNIIPAQGGNGGAAAADYSGMFEEAAAVETKLSKTIEQLRKTLKVDDIIGTIKINWTKFTEGFGFNGETVAKTVILGLGTLLGKTALMTLIPGPGGAVLGTILGVTLGLQATSALFNNDSKLGKDELIRSLLVVLGGVTGYFAFSNLGTKGAWLGATVGSVLAISLIDGSFDKTLSKLNLDMFSNSLKVVLGAATGALIGWKIAKGTGALYGMTIGSILSLMALDGGDGVFKNGGLDGMTMIKRLLAILTAATMGFIVWGFTGSTVAGVLAFNLSLAISELDWSLVKKAVTDAFDRTKQWFDLQLRNFMHWIKGENQEQAIINVQTGKVTYRTVGDNYQSEWFNPKVPISGSFAEGGTPNMGSLFVAGERGPEFVTQLGGQSQVYNEDQLSGSLAIANEPLIDAVLQSATALIAAINNKDLTIGDRDIASSATRGNRLNGRAMVV